MLLIQGGNDRSIHYVHDVNRGHNPDVSHQLNHVAGRSLCPDGAQMMLTSVMVHKSQGSQFNRVIVPITENRLLDMTLIYTAITRGVTQVVLVGDGDAAKKAILSPPSLSKRHVTLPTLLTSGFLGFNFIVLPAINVQKFCSSINMNWMLRSDPQRICKLLLR